MKREIEVIVGVLAFILMLVFMALDGLFAKRVPAHRLRSPRYVTVAGIVTLAFCAWLILEMLRAEDGETVKLAYLLFGIPFCTLLGAGGIAMLLHGLNWRLDIKEDCIVYRNALRCTRTVYFAEITEIKSCKTRFGLKPGQRPHNSKDWIGDCINEFILSKFNGSYRIYIGKKSIEVSSFVYNYDGSAERILKAMKKQGIECPVTTKKTRKPNP